MRANLISLLVSAGKLALAVLLAGIVAMPALPRQQPAKGKIAQIKFEGLRKYSEAQMDELSGLHPGDVAGREDLQAAADRLAQAGLFTNVSYQFQSRGEELRVTFRVEEAPAVPVLFDNIPWYTDDELIAAIRNGLPWFDGTAPQQGPFLEQMASAVQKLLELRGLHVAVEHELTNDPASDALAQVFRVTGAAQKIARVQFGDPLAAESRLVQQRLSDLVGKPFSRIAIVLFLNEQVRPIYLQKGYLRVRFDRPQVRLTGDPTRPLPDAIQVFVPMDHGTAYRWGGTHWTGNRAFTAESLEKFLTMKPDDPADGMKIAATWEHVEDEYARSGYLDVKLAEKPVYDDAGGRVRYDVTVSEGVQYHMGELVITGLSLNAERKLRGAWPVPVGVVFDRMKFDDLLVKLQARRSEVFGDLPIHYEEAGHWLRTNSATAVVDVLLDFK